MEERRKKIIMNYFFLPKMTSLSFAPMLLMAFYIDVVGFLVKKSTKKNTSATIGVSEGKIFF